MQATTVEDARRLARVLTLVEHNARTAVIQSLTNIPKGLIRNLYRELLGRSAPSGLMKASCESLFSNTSTHILASYFALFYAGRTESDEYDRLITAYTQYQALTRNIGRQGKKARLDFNDAWLISRDFRIKVASLKHCRKCSTDYLVGRCPGVTCPVCKLTDSARCHVCGTPIQGKSGCARCAQNHDQPKEQASACPAQAYSVVEGRR